jgi:Putative restriction endonuclease
MNSSIPIEKPMLEADAIGVRLEVVKGLPMWEASPTCAHQLEIDRIRSSFVFPSGDRGKQHTISSVYFRFVDGSFKRPDIAVLPRVPLESEMDSALEIVPEAVVEIISEGYEDKDMKIAPSFYLTQGVKDVLIFDPRAKLIRHHRVDSVHRYNSPQGFNLECGCECIV